MQQANAYKHVKQTIVQKVKLLKVAKKEHADPSSLTYLHSPAASCPPQTSRLNSFQPPPVNLFLAHVSYAKEQCVPSLKKFEPIRSFLKLVTLKYSIKLWQNRS